MEIGVPMPFSSRSGMDLAVGLQGSSPPITADPLESPRASKNFCHGCFEEESLEIEDELSGPLNFHPRSVIDLAVEGLNYYQLDGGSINLVNFLGKRYFHSF